MNTMLYMSMLETAIETGWPRGYKGDLLYHDRRFLTEHPDVPFVWVLRENGTDLFPLWEHTNEVDLAWFDAVVRDKTVLIYAVSGNRVVRVGRRFARRQIERAARTPAEVRPAERLFG